MASALTGVMTSVINKLTALLGKEYMKLKGVQGEVEFMKDELSSMNALLHRLAEEDQHLDLQTKEWRNQVREMSYDIEDCIDDFMHHLGHTGIAESAGLVHRMAQLLKTLRVRHQIANQIEKLKARVEDASKRRLRDVVIKLLTEGEGASSQKLKVISIVGPGGLGKTTLANEVFRKLESQFQCRAFVSLSQQPDVKKIVRNIYCQVSQQDYGSIDIWDEEKLIKATREFLTNKRYFVVIDDIWSTQAWKTIKCALFVNNCGSRIMTTTRNMAIAKSCCTPDHDRVFEIMPLNIDSSKSLFLKRIFGSKDVCIPQLDEVCYEILKKCGGSPLAIITIASLLANKANTKEEWERVCNSIGSTLQKDPDVEEMRRILSLSYDDLPQHLKTCLLYLSIFPEDYEIERDRLVKRWIAEGFITTEGGHDLKEIGDCYFNDLINRSMIEPVKIRCDGRVCSCRVHDMILDLLTCKSTEENFATFMGGQNQKLALQGKVRRLSLNYYTQDHIMVPSTAIISHCRSLSIFGYAEQKPPLSMFPVLRVLDIENGEDMESSYTKHIRKLIQLKYLRLNVRSVAELPEQLGELQNLQTLDLRRTNIRKLPESFVRLQNLTSLRVNNLELPEGIGHLHALQELTEIRISQDCLASSLLELRSLTKLRFFGLRWCITQAHIDYKVFADNLVSSLRKLGRLNLRTICILGYYACSIEFLLDSWFPSPHLLQSFAMGMNYHFPRVPSWIASLDNLTCLEINIDLVDEKVIQILGDLPVLIFLWLTSKEAGPNERLVIRSNMFVCLKEFHFTCWRNWEGLMFEAGAMAKVEMLRVSFDAGGSVLDFGIQHLASLRHLIVEIVCGGATLREVEALEDAIRHSADLLPWHPAVEVRTWDEEKMVKEEVQIMAEEKIHTNS
ncbi:disease resistance protein PIK6-NP-like isoform X2 [Oryza glaberrima]|uniref:disease resistance protein PIK6-NP-like isoform X2 n=1 Tax=Oryza glaberrima TaxID=4538 RepID=UPI00224C2D9E|nr:disease resistance protein PIK6-NP-like isoform X2 [Oryza glaberrima]